MTLLRSVSLPHWRSSLQRSRSMVFGQWRSTALDQPSGIPQLFSDWGRRVFYSTSGQLPAAVTLMVHSSRSFDRWLLSRWHFFVALSTSSSAGGTSRTRARLLALSTRPMMFPALWQVPWGSRSLCVSPKSRLTSPGSCSGGAVLALVRPVVYNTLALLAAFSAGCVSGNSALQQRCSGRPVASPASYRVALYPCCSTLLLKLKISKIIIITKKTQSTTISNRCPRWPETSN